MTRTKTHYCALFSCIHHHSSKRKCTIGLSRRDGECPEYQPKEKRLAPICYLQGCAHFYLDNWKKRCRLGLRHLNGKCEHYTPRPREQRRGKNRKVPHCTKSSCVHCYFDLDSHNYRCKLGLTRRAREECPEYQPKRKSR